MGENTGIFIEQDQNSKLSKTFGFSFFLTKAVWCGFLLLVFLLALLSPTIHLKSQNLALTDFIFPLIFTLWLIGILLRQFQFRWHRFYWLLAFYLAAMILSTIFSPNFTQSILKLTGGIYLLILAVLTFNLVRNEKDFKQVIFAWLIGTAVAVAVGIITILLFYIQPQNRFLDYTTSIYGAVPVGNYPRLQSTFVSASMFCNYLTVSLAMLFIAEKTKLIGKILFSVLYFSILVCAVFTISSGIGGIALFIGVWYWAIYRNSKKTLARLSLAGAFTSALLFSLMNCVALQVYSTAPYSIAVPFSEMILFPSPRFLVWTDSLKTFTENFFYGNGLGRPSCEVLFQNTDGNFSLLTDAHNTFLNVAAQNGIFGLLAIAVITLYFLRQTLYLKPAEDFSSITFAGLILAFLAAFVFQGLTGSFEDARHLWILIGLILSVGKKFLPTSRFIC